MKKMTREESYCESYYEGGDRYLIYLGSKRRLSKYLVPIIQSYITDSTTGYIEPFVGGGNMIDKIDAKVRIGSDRDKYCIAVLQGLQANIEPPKEVSYEQYCDIKAHKEKYSDFLTGYIGYELSFGGKWFAGYVKRSDEKFRGDIYSYNHCMKQAPKLKGIDFRCCTYDTYKNLKGYVIYCDPPYKGTTKYSDKSFDYDKFYDWCRGMAKHNIVLISEYSMPNDFTCIWEQRISVSLDSKKDKSDDKNIRIEKLFTYSIEQCG